MPPLTFGYLYDFRNPEQFYRPWDELYAETLETIAWTESVGFAGAWVPEHHLADDGYMPSPLVTLAAIAARTSTIRIGTGVALAPLYHPVRFAEETAILDILSRGRLELGLAIGYRRRETEAFGVDFGRRGAIFDEFLQIVTALWAGESVSFEGKHFTIKDAKIVPPAPRGKVPLYIGGFAEKALARVARFGDGYFGNPEVSDPYLAKVREQGKEPAEARMRIPGLFEVVAHDPAEAMEELAPYYHYVNNAYSVFLNEDKAIGIDDPMLKPMDLEAFKTSGILQIRTPDQAIDRFRRLREKMPLEHFMMMLPPGLPHDRFRHYAQVFADEVIPAFA
jgi:probable F420-dependent oxidoreductase